MSDPAEDEAYTPEFAYTWQDWSEDLRLLQEEAPEGTDDAFSEWFQRRYKNPKEATWKAARQYQAAWRMDELLNAYPEEFRDFTIGNTVSAHLYLAFWQLYGGVPDEELENHPSAEEVLELARENEARNQQGRR